MEKGKRQSELERNIKGTFYYEQVKMVVGI